MTKSKFQMRKIFLKLQAVGLIRPWIAEFIIQGYLPEGIGRYRVLNTQLDWSKNVPE